jgi:uncharacterized protein involved in type VI secretion and phage assembly
MTNTNAAKLDIEVEGSSLAPEVHQSVIEARVELGISISDRLTLRIADPELKIIDGATINVGNKIEAKLGAPGSTTTTSVFKGEVVSVEADIGPLGAQVAIVAFDKSHRLRRNTHVQTFTQVTLADIATQIASKNGLQTGTIEADGATRNDVLQHSESDWALLERLCNEADCDIDIDGDSLNLRKRQASNGSVVALSIGETLRSFRPRLSGVAQIDTVRVRTWDPTQKQAIDQQAKPKPPVSAAGSERDAAASALGGGDIVIVDHPAESTGLATSVAQSAADRLAATVVEATGVAVGTPELKPGGVVELGKVGKRFGGEHRIVAVTHVYRGALGYETRFTLGAGGRSLVQEFGSRPRINDFAGHLAIGVVTNNSDDDAGGRVKVKYPALDPDAESVWARIAWPAAGKTRGIVAIPEVGDEVVVGFEHGDIERPFVLGVLFNGQDTPGEFLVDTEETSVAVQMPRDINLKTDGKVTTVAQKDITIESSQGAIAIKADQTGIKLTSMQALELSSTQATTKLSGMSGTTIQDQATITINANGSLSIKSNGAVEIQGSTLQVSATGILQLSGSEVMIG